jgi:hypothetical protein
MNILSIAVTTVLNIVILVPGMSIILNVATTTGVGKFLIDHIACLFMAACAENILCTLPCPRK